MVQSVSLNVANLKHYLQGAREAGSLVKGGMFSWPMVKGAFLLATQEPGIRAKLRGIALIPLFFGPLANQELESEKRAELNLGEHLHMLFCDSGGAGDFNRDALNEVLQGNDLTRDEKALLSLMIERYEILSFIDPKQPAYAYERLTQDPALLDTDKRQRLEQINLELKRLF